MINDTYQSLTTPEIQHDAANMLTEFIILNTNLKTGRFPWRQEEQVSWGKNVAAIKKLMKAPYHLTAEQIAFYIYKCSPKNINPFEFSKMAVVARKLFRPYGIEELRQIYLDRMTVVKGSGLEGVEHKKDKPKSLLTLLRELENGKA
jgi:hypothetical protein